MTTAKWIDEAEKHIGLKELTGSNDHPLLLSWWITLGAKYLYKQAWCGTFVAHCMKIAGYPIPKHWYRAKDWLNWGHSVIEPVYGCVAVFTRDGGGHVGFVVGKDSLGRVMVLGGNQGNAVSIKPFDKSRVAGYRLPVGYESAKELPLMVTQLQSSTNEA